MKKLALIIFAFTFFTFNGFSQGCLPEGITFNSQQQIDDFQSDYPGCSEILGDVEINGNDITSLNGLNILTSIGGYLLIEDNPSLMNLTGLESLITIESGFRVLYNTSLTSLTGLDNLTSISGDLYIESNWNLANILALSNLTNIALLRINNNNMLTHLNGLEGITGAYQIYIQHNASLQNLAGLDNLNSVSYIFRIGHNNALTSIDLGNLHSVMWFHISHNSILTSLSGLDNLSSAYVLDILDNDALTDLSGLENLASVDAGLIIHDNNSLSNLNGIQNLVSIGGNLFLKNNISLSDIFALENTDIESSSQLLIRDNSVLSICEVQSICDYLVSPSGTIDIQNNAPGCNSQTEVEETCPLGTNETKYLSNTIQIFPNPAKSTITILNSSIAKIEEVIIYNPSGKTILQKKAPNNTIDISKLQPGLYFVEVKTEMGDARRKLIVK